MGNDYHAFEILKSWLVRAPRQTKLKTSAGAPSVVHARSSASKTQLPRKFTDFSHQNSPHCPLFISHHDENYTPFDTSHAYYDDLLY